MVLGQDSVFLDDEGHDRVGVQALEEQEHEAGGEEKVYQDGLNPAKLEIIQKQLWKV